MGPLERSGSRLLWRFGPQPAAQWQGCLCIEHQNGSYHFADDIEITVKSRTLTTVCLLHGKLTQVNSLPNDRIPLLINAARLLCRTQFDAFVVAQFYLACVHCALDSLSTPSWDFFADASASFLSKPSHLVSPGSFIGVSQALYNYAGAALNRAQKWASLAEFSDPMLQQTLGECVGAGMLLIFRQPAAEQMSGVAPSHRS